MKRARSALLLSLVLGCGYRGTDSEAWLNAQSADPLVMVVNKSNSAATEMNKGLAKRLLLGEMTAWPNGTRVVVVLQPLGNSDRSQVLSKVCGMSEAEYTRHNLQAAFMGTAVAEVQQEASVSAAKAFVKSNSGAVAFLHKSEVDDNEKIAWTLP